MIKVGLVGEDPNDTSSIKNLLEQRYNGKVQFKELTKNSTGANLDSLGKFKRVLKKKFDDSNCSFIVYVRDLDELESHKEKLSERIKWFKDLNDHVNSDGILMLNIWELEALILGDIETFNKMYNVSHKPGNPMFVRDPKKVLIDITSKNRKQFKESHCPDIFKQLSIDKVERNCSCFKKFIAEFNEKLN
ncbi:DUF4276 family protein [Mucilaginibacter sp. P25]|uniref:DUF4276 family protein n=1 Tax=Mucilaginibacter gossypii TaxID=551996 RepID=A0A1G8IKV4_9SPHI|nr:DUF4276 family protein [Mucilaginibacter gossypii]SDI19421.1 protein of unknown function [Mucilaginibacter gossypii]